MSAETGEARRLTRATPAPAPRRPRRRI